MNIKEEKELLNKPIYIYDKHSADDSDFKGTGYNKVVKCTLKDVFKY